MRKVRFLNLFLKLLMIIGFNFSANISFAANILEYLTENDRHIAADVYTGPSLEDNVALMDTDKNGFADVMEVRAYLEKLHGKGYQQALLEKLEASARGQSCSTPFAKELYVDNSTEQIINN